MWWHNENAVICKGRGPSVGNQIRWHLDLELLVSRTVRNNICCLSHPVCVFCYNHLNWLKQTISVLLRDESQARTGRAFGELSEHFTFLTWALCILQLPLLGPTKLLLYWEIHWLPENVLLLSSFTVFVLFSITNCSTTFTSFIGVLLS